MIFLVLVVAILAIVLLKPILSGVFTANAMQNITNTRQQNNASIAERLKNAGYVINTSFSCENGFSIYVSSTNKILWAHRDYPAPGQLQQVAFEDVVGCEILKNGTVSDGAGRAALGGILAGSTGAIIGATTGTLRAERIDAVIYTNDIANPLIKFQVFQNIPNSSYSDTFYNSALEFCDRLVATIKAIVAQNEAAKK